MGQEESGAASSELMLLFGLILVLTMFPIQVALFWHAQQSAVLAAEVALDVGQRIDATTGEAESAGQSVVASTNQLLNPTVTVSRNSASRTVSVVVAGDLRYQILPLNWVVRSEASGRIEEFVSENER